MTAIPIKEKLTLTDIFADNRIRKIHWGEDFLNWPEERQLKYAMSLASAMNQAAEKMMEDRDRWITIAQVAEAKAIEADKARQIAVQVMTKNVTESNSLIQDLQREIQKLQGELAECRREH